MKQVLKVGQNNSGLFDNICMWWENLQLSLFCIFLAILNREAATTENMVELCETIW